MTSSAVADGAATTTRRTQRILDLTVGANFLAVGIMLTAVPRFVREELGGSKFDVGVATTIFFASALFSRPIAGRMMDRVGRRPFLRWALLGMAAVVLSLVFADSVWAVVGIRVVQGAVGSTAYTAAAAMTTDLAVPERRSAAVARLSLVIYLGFGVGPFIGDALFGRGATWVWGVAAGLHVVAFVCSWWLPETAPAAVGVGSPLPPGPQRRVWRAVMRPGLAQMTAGLGYACVIAFVPSYAVEVGLRSSAGLFLTYSVSALAVRTILVRLTSTVKPVDIARIGLGIQLTGLITMASATTPWMPYLGVALCGLGVGAVFPGLTAMAVERISAADRGAALGAFFAFNDLGNALAGPLVGAIADSAGYRWSYWTPAIAVAIGLLSLSARLNRSASP